MREFVSYKYCCKGEDYNCWLNVEGIDYGWLWLDKDPIEMPEILFNYTLDTLKSYRKILYKRKMFVIEKNDKIIIHIFLRDINKTDYVIVFSK